MKTSRNNQCISALLAASVLLLMAPLAEAIIPGPAGVGGVARRTVRRTTVVVAGTTTAVAASTAATANANAAAQQQTAAANQAAAASAAAAQQSAAAAQQAAAASQATQGTAGLASLPPGCTPVGGDYKCGGTYYRPYFIGGSLVYKPVPAPQ